ncbi:MAG: hypothetical protein ACKPKO_32640, partial [Candidatus Fonsibacter sp.]
IPINIFRCHTAIGAFAVGKQLDNKTTRMRKIQHIIGIVVDVLKAYPMKNWLTVLIIQFSGSIWALPRGSVLSVLWFLERKYNA